MHPNHLLPTTLIVNYICEVSLNQQTLKIANTIQQNGWKRLLLAVSGGLDSICLANYFVQNKGVLGLEWLGIAHVHHGLRKTTADLDAELVHKFASQNNIPFFIENLDGSALKNATGSLEENARNARYAALVCFAKDVNADSIVTAHHAGDQAETIYLRVLRGVTLSGLQGIKQVRKIADTFLYRPFLQVTRDSLLRYAQENNLSWREDESNQDTKFARNKIRHDSLPGLERQIPGASAQICKIAAIAEKSYKKVIQAADAVFSGAIIPAEDWPFEGSISPYARVLALDASFFDSEKSPLAKIFESNPEMLRLWLDNQGFRFPLDAFTKKKIKPSGNSAKKSSILPDFYNYRTRFIEKCRHIIWIYDSRFIQAPTNLYFSNDKQKFSGTTGLWRPPMQEDVLSPLDMKIKPRKLATWLQENGVPRWIRPSLQVFAQDSRVVYVSGVRIDKSLKKG